MLSTACAKLAFCLLVYRMCSLFALPSETEHINMIADQFRMIPYDKLHGSPRETPRGIPRVQDSPRRWEAQKIAHNVVLSTARALCKPPKGLCLCAILSRRLYVVLVWSLATPGAMGDLVTQGVPQGIPWGM